MAKKLSKRVLFPFLKVRAFESRRVVLASSRAVTFATHFLGGKPLLCPSLGCEACFLTSRGASTFLIVGDLLTGRCMLLELSAFAFERLLGVTEGDVSPGLVVVVSRASVRSPLGFDLAAEVRTDVVGRDPLPAVAQVYGLPSPERSEDEQAWFKRVTPYLESRVASAVGRAASRVGVDAP